MEIKELDELVKKYKTGDELAFEDLYHATYQSVYYTIYLLTHNTSRIDDFIQDTYYTALNRLESYHMGTNFKAWLCRIAHNLTINALLKIQKEIPLDPERENEALFGPAPTKDDRIEKALDLLDGLEKEVFIHLIVEGFSVKETAVIMGVNINRIYYLQSLMKKSLKFIFDNY